MLRVNPKINYGLWVTMMYQYRFLNCNKCTTLVGDADNEGGYARVGGRGIREISVPSSEFCYEPTFDLKKIKS